MKHVIHVHQQKMRAGLDAIIDRTYRGSRHTRRLRVYCPCCGEQVGEFVQTDEPDRCGARVTFVTEGETHPGAGPCPTAWNFVTEARS